MEPVKRIQLKTLVERVLHVPGNYQGGILELTLVVDAACEKEEIRFRCKELITCLKSFGEVFQNVRLNLVIWSEDEVIKNQVSSTASILTGSFFEQYEKSMQEKSIEVLFAYLKKFHARSKLIFVLMSQPYVVKDETRYHQSLQPFLYRKLIIQQGDDDYERVHL